jgi:hypothetical protein
MTRLKSERGAALLEAAITIPMLLLIAIGIFEFGRAFQTWQILTNAAREGARIAVLPSGGAPGVVEERVRDYMAAGQLPEAGEASVSVNRSATITVNGANVSASQVTISYPFSFRFLQPVMELVAPGSGGDGPLTMSAQALMRNETQ